MEDFAEAYFDQLREGGWPSEGPRNRQAAWYVRAKALADVERAKIEAAPAAAIDMLYGG